MSARQVAWPAGARELLASARVAHLATADAAGVPHVVPFCSVLLGDRLYSVIDEKPKATKRVKRLRNIETNPQVAVVADVYDDDWSRLAYVLVHGRAGLVDAATEHGRALAELRRKYPQYQTMDLTFDAHPMLRIDVDRVHLWRARPTPGNRDA